MRKPIRAEITSLERDSQGHSPRLKPRLMYSEYGLYEDQTCDILVFLVTYFNRKISLVKNDIFFISLHFYASM